MFTCVTIVYAVHICGQFGFTSKLGCVQVCYPIHYMYSHSQWRNNEYQRMHAATAGKPFVCPACGDEPYVVHLDGNNKLYRYSAAGRYLLLQNDLFLHLMSRVYCAHILPEQAWYR
jgi:hypothetical protein